MGWFSDNNMGGAALSSKSRQKGGAKAAVSSAPSNGNGARDIGALMAEAATTYDPRTGRQITAPSAGFLGNWGQSLTPYGRQQVALSPYRSGTLDSEFFDDRYRDFQLQRRQIVRNEAQKAMNALSREIGRRPGLTADQRVNALENTILGRVGPLRDAGFDVSPMTRTLPSESFLGQIFGRRDENAEDVRTPGEAFSSLHGQGMLDYDQEAQRWEPNSTAWGATVGPLALRVAAPIAANLSGPLGSFAGLLARQAAPEYETPLANYSRPLRAGAVTAGLLGSPEAASVLGDMSGFAGPASDIARNMRFSNELALTSYGANYRPGQPLSSPAESDARREAQGARRTETEDSPPNQQSEESSGPNPYWNWTMYAANPYSNPLFGWGGYV